MAQVLRGAARLACLLRRDGNRCSVSLQSFNVLAAGVGMGVAFMLLFARLGYFSFDVGQALPAIAAISGVATVMESLPINQSVDDNLSVPGIAALLGYYFLQTL